MILEICASRCRKFFFFCVREGVVGRGGNIDLILLFDFKVRKVTVTLL